MIPDNLFAVSNVDLKDFVAELPLRNKLNDIMSSPSVLPQGGSLAFCCRHKYSNSAIATDPSGCLKGEDAIMFATLKSFHHVSVKVCALFKASYNRKRKRMEIFMVSEKIPAFFTTSDSINTDFDSYLEIFSAVHSIRWDSRPFLTNYCAAVPLKEQDVIWIGKPSHEIVACVSIAYGNAAFVHQTYFHAVILASIPASRFGRSSLNMHKLDL